MNLGAIPAALFIGALVAQLPETLPLAMFFGALGGIVRVSALWLHDDTKPSTKSLAEVLVGAISAGPLWVVSQPFLEQLFGSFSIEPISALIFGAFMIGLMGVTFIMLIFDFVTMRRQNIRSDRAHHRDQSHSPHVMPPDVPRDPPPSEDDNTP